LEIQKIRSDRIVVLSDRLKVVDEWKRL